MKNLTFLIVLFSATAFARQEGLSHAPHGLCRASFHSDSAGRGIEAGFKNLDLRPNPLDENCYDQGVVEGQTLPKNDSFCTSDFESGKQQGLDAGSDSSGSECYTKGYIAGFALLGVAARAGDASTVGSDCIADYQSGLSDGKNGEGPNAMDSNRGSACYMTGFYDASAF